MRWQRDDPDRELDPRTHVILWPVSGADREGAAARVERVGGIEAERQRIRRLVGHSHTVRTGLARTKLRIEEWPEMDRVRPGSRRRRDGEDAISGRPACAAWHEKTAGDDDEGKERKDEEAAHVIEMGDIERPARPPATVVSPHNLPPERRGGWRRGRHPPQSTICFVVSVFWFCIAI